MQRSLETSAPLACARPRGAAPLRRGRAGRCERPRQDARRQIDDRHARRRPARGGGRGHGLEQLPGEPWTGEQAKTFAAASAAGSNPRERRAWRTPRRRSTFPSSRSGSTQRFATRWSSPRSTSSGSATSSSPPSGRGSAPTRFQRPHVTSVPVRDGPIPTGRDPGGGLKLPRPPRRRRSWPGSYIQRATKYVLAVVLFATSLFFAGISTKLNRTRLRGVILGVGCVVFVVAASWIRDVPDQPVDLNGIGSLLSAQRLRRGPIPGSACIGSAIAERGAPVYGHFSVS